MKAIYFSSFGGPEVLQYGEIPNPSAGPDRLIILVKAVSLNAADYKMRNGYLKIAGDPVFPRIPGSDFAGIVKETGDGVTLFKPCDKVYGFIPTISGEQGAMAELVVASKHLVRHLPEGMAFEEAAALPAAALTALNGLRNGGNLSGKSVLVNGATGGVGHFAVQLARAQGARVTAMCSSRNADLALKLGASEVIDYKTTDPETLGKKFDLILDAYGLMKRAGVYRLLKRKGVYASTLFFGSNLAAALVQFFSGKKLASAGMRSWQLDFEEIESYFTRGQLHPVVENTFPLKSAADAFRLSEGGKSRGKIVVRI